MSVNNSQYPWRKKTEDFVSQCH